MVVTIQAALKLFDILELVASFLEPRDILQLGRTCQVLTPSLDVYWKDRVVHLDRLIFLFPKDVLRKERGDPEIGFIRRPLPEDWDLLVAGARRIQILRSSHKLDEIRQVRPEVYLALAYECPVPDLFPSLRHLNMEIASNEELQILINCLKPQVTQLSVKLAMDLPRWDELSRPSMQLLKSIPTRAPLLTHLTLDSRLRSRDYDHAGALQEIISLVTSVHRLDLGLTRATPSLLKEVATLPKLDNLTCLIGEDIAPLRAVSHESPLFTSIRKLDVKGPHALSIFPLISSWVLSDVHVYMDRGSAVDFSNALTFLSRRHQSLRTMSVTIADTDRTDESEWPADVLTFPFVRPLLSCHNVTHIRLVHIFPLSLDDADVLAIVQECPNIHTLHLNPTPQKSAHVDRPLHFSSSMTLAVLPGLAPICPKLRYLSLFLDATRVPAASNSEAPPRPFIALRSLNMGISPIEDPLAVCQLVQVLLPGLQYLHSEARGANPSNGTWTSVMRHLKEAQIARESHASSSDSSQRG